MLYTGWRIGHDTSKCVGILETNSLRDKISKFPQNNESQKKFNIKYYIYVPLPFECIFNWLSYTIFEFKIFSFRKVYSKYRPSNPPKCQRNYCFELDFSFSRIEPSGDSCYIRYIIRGWNLWMWGCYEGLQGKLRGLDCIPVT